MFLEDSLTLRESVFSPSKAIFLQLCRLTDRIVGEGGFGKVYRVRCMKTRKVITAYSRCCFGILMNASLEPRAQGG
jgi:hypothetical protein